MTTRVAMPDGDDVEAEDVVRTAGELGVDPVDEPGQRHRVLVLEGEGPARENDPSGFVTLGRMSQ